MKVMLTNDDGVVSEGIRTMSRMLSEKDLLAAVIAPDRERSGSGHSITVGWPVRITPLAPGFFASNVTAYACDGTPSDCTNLGIDLLFPNVDLVVSGINQGPNLGDDVTYSGTVCAALESVILGKPAIAVSLVCDAGAGFRHNTTAAIAAMAVIEWIEEHPLPAGTFLNINVPNVLLPALKGFKLTRRGVRRYSDKFTKIKDPSGKDCYWISGHAEDELEDGTDNAAVAAGYVSVTPMHVDMTDHSFLSAAMSDGAEGQLNTKINL